MKALFLKIGHGYSKFYGIIGLLLSIGIVELWMYSDAIVALMAIPEAAPILVVAFLILVSILIYVRRKKSHRKVKDIDE